MKSTLITKGRFTRVAVLCIIFPGYQIITPPDMNKGLQIGRLNSPGCLPQKSSKKQHIIAVLEVGSQWQWRGLHADLGSVHIWRPACLVRWKNQKLCHVLIFGPRVTGKQDRLLATSCLPKCFFFPSTRRPSVASQLVIVPVVQRLVSTTTIKLSLGRNATVESQFYPLNQNPVDQICSQFPRTVKIAAVSTSAGCHH